MTKLQLEALKYTPKRFMIDGTNICEFNDRVFLANEKLNPVSFNPKTKRWRFMRFKPGPFKITQIETYNDDDPK